jgi:hypothetical protein
MPDSGTPTPGARERGVERPLRPGYEERIRATELCLMSELEQQARMMRQRAIDYTWSAEAAAVCADEDAVAYRENVRRILETTAAFLDLDRPAGPWVLSGAKHVESAGRLWTHKVDPATFA